MSDLSSSSDTTQDLTVAEIILSQLGGKGRLRAMIGAHDFARTERAVTFKFKGSRVANSLWIELNGGKDLYDVKFLKIGRLSSAISSTILVTNVHVADLKTLIEETVQLSLSL